MKEVLVEESDRQAIEPVTGEIVVTPEGNVVIGAPTAEAVVILSEATE